jgi:predicted  nucleic acid-binding Zn-ribbon protein
MSVQLGSFKFIHVVRLDASPAMIRLVERITGGASPEAFDRIMQAMETMRERLDALRAAVEADETRRQEIIRLKKDAEDARVAEQIEDDEEAAEDAATQAMIEEWTRERAALETRIAELEAIPKMSQAEAAELDELITRLNSGPPAPDVVVE